MSNLALLTIPAAAKVLGISVATLRRWIKEGAPVARRGRRGKGHATLVDPEAVRLWRLDRKGQGDGTAALRAFAWRVPELVADGLDKSYRRSDGPHKPALMRELAGCWYRVLCKLWDELREEVPDLPEISDEITPENIKKLREIGH